MRAWYEILYNVFVFVEFYYRGYNKLNKLVVLMVVVATGLLVAAPAVAQVSFEINDTENESGGIETETEFEITGNNNNACAGLQQFGQSGSFTNQQGGLQYDSDSDDFESGGQEGSFAPESEQECEQRVQQAAAASSVKAAPAEKKEEKKVEVKKEEKKVEVKPAEKKEEKKEEVVVKAEAGEKKEEKKEEKKKELPKAGGTGSASLLALGAGALLVGGGLLVRRFVR